MRRSGIMSLLSIICWTWVTILSVSSMQGLAQASRPGIASTGCFVCETIVAPVCGSDGRTYSNACWATCANVTYFPGECPGCGCKLEYKPVCGANGKTYNSACGAECAGFSYTKGPCKCLACEQFPDPVCSRDGKEYLNECVATDCYNVTIFATGRCPKPGCTTTKDCCKGADCFFPRGVVRIRQCVLPNDAVCPTCPDGFSYQGGVCKAKPCRSTVGCTTGYMVCMSPGQAPLCGFLRRVQDPCQSDMECSTVTKGTICEEQRCADGPECIAGCKKSTECPAGQYCCFGRCQPKHCTKDSDCGSPAEFQCAKEKCARRTCMSDTNCRAGGYQAHCVNTKCYSTLGTCSYLPP